MTEIKYKLPENIFRTIIVVFAAVMTSSCMDCETSLLEVEAAMQADCWSCELFSLAYNGVNAWATSTYSTVCTSTKSLLLVGFGLWLAIQLLQHLSSISAQKVGEFWTKVGQRTFVFVFAAAVLSSQSNTLWAHGYTIYPIIVGCIEFASGITGGECGAPNLTEGGAAALPPGVGESIGCIIGTMNSSLIAAKVGCIKMMCVGEDDTIMGAIGGTIAWFFLTLVDTVFPLYLIDAVIRLGIVSALLPLMIASWVFESTKFLAKAGFKMLFNSGMNLVVMTVTMGLMGAAISNVLGQFTNASDMDNVPAWLLEGMQNGLLVLQVLAIAWISLQTCTKSPEIANHFAPLHASLDTTAASVIAIAKIAWEIAKASASGGASLGDTAAKMATEGAAKDANAGTGDLADASTAAGK